MREGWVETTLGEVAEWFSGGTPKAGDPNFYEDGSIPWAVIADMSDPRIQRTANHITEAGLAAIGGRTAPIGSVLVSMYASVGKSALTEIELATNQAIAWGIPNRKLVDPTFLFFSTQLLEQTISAMARGATQRNINRGMLREFTFALPPLAEQRRIVDVIESVDTYIAALEKRAETLSDSSAAIVTAIFQDPESVVVPLASLCDKAGIQIGPFGSQLHASEYIEDGIPAVMPRDLTSNGFDTSSLTRVSEQKAQELSKHRVVEGDILFARRGDLRKRALVTNSESGWICGTGTVRVRLAHIEPRLAYFALTTPEVNNWLTDHAVGATMPNLNSQIVANIPVRIPKHPELAVAAIEATNKVIAAVSATLTSARNLRSALLSNLLSGDHGIPSSYDNLLGAA